MGAGELNEMSSATQRDLRELFDCAAAMSLAVDCRLDAEPEMKRFLEAIKAHPEERAFVVQLFFNSFSSESRFRVPPTDLLMYCMSDLKWAEIRNFVQAQRDEDIKSHGVPCYAIWTDILEAFEDDWRSKYFTDFTIKGSS
jgi:hypothetical protein